MDWVVIVAIVVAVGLAFGAGALYGRRGARTTGTASDPASQGSAAEWGGNSGLGSASGLDGTASMGVSIPAGLKDVLRVVPSAAVVVGADGRVHEASQATYACGLVRGDRIVSRELAEAIMQVHQSGELLDMEFQTSEEHYPRRSHMWEARVAPLGDQWVVVLADDKTEIKRAEAIRREFVANVSHELKTPIGAVTLLAEAMTNSADDPEAVARFGDRMHKECRRLTELVKEIIDLSRVQDHDQDFAGNVSVPDVIDEALERSKVAAEAKNIQLSSLHVGEWQVRGSFELLVTAVRNLVDNAIHYSNAGTEVGVGAKLEGDTVNIAVSDHGIGLSLDDQARVFERFYRVDRARSRMTGGSGLGLSIVKHIAETHGGEVRVWSKLRQGSTFTLVLPLAKRHADVAQASRVADAEQTPRTAQTEHVPRTTEEIEQP